MNEKTKITSLTRKKRTEKTATTAAEGKRVKKYENAKKTQCVDDDKSSRR